MANATWQRFVVGIAVALFFAAALSAQQAPAPAQRPVFRGNTQIISVDVIVRDASGAVVKGLTAADFEILEDLEVGGPQSLHDGARRVADDDVNGDDLCIRPKSRLPLDAAWGRLRRRGRLLPLDAARGNPELVEGLRRGGRGEEQGDRERHDQPLPLGTCHLQFSPR